jgi:hypothetical protein
MENPLVGAFNRERTVLVFRQRSLEAQAAFWAVIGGSAMFLFGLYLRVFSVNSAAWWFGIFGGAFAAAGLWAYLLFRYVKFDLRKRTYVERYGSGFWIRWRTGSIDEVNCLGLESYQGLLPQVQLGQTGWSVGGPQAGYSPSQYPGHVYVVRLWWKDASRYPPVVEHLFTNRASGYGPDQGMASFHALAQSYAHALKVPLYGQLS